MIIFRASRMYFANEGMSRNYEYFVSLPGFQLPPGLKNPCHRTGSGAILLHFQSSLNLL